MNSAHPPSTKTDIETSNPVTLIDREPICFMPILLINLCPTTCGTGRQRTVVPFL
jgi:hypothetical protein